MTSAANAIDEEWVEKKLKGANSSQDSVQSLSLWALNHKTQHEKIVGIWFKVLKTAKLDLRLTLFYLCNEVVQTCKRKHAIVFKDAFKEVLKDAALLVRDNSIRPNIERIFKIWEERHVYNKEFVDELMAILNNTKVKSTLSTRLLAEFKPDELMVQMKRMADMEEEVEAKRLQLSEQEWHSVDVESFKQQLKDRHECFQYVEQVNDCQRQLESYVKDLEQETRGRSSLIQLLEHSELYYDAQNSEANIVATAYKNFGSRVSSLDKRLREMFRLQSKSSPGNRHPPPPSSVPVEKDSRGQAKRKQDPASTPTFDEFDDESYDGSFDESLHSAYSTTDSSPEPFDVMHESDETGNGRHSTGGQMSPNFPTDQATRDISAGSILQNLMKGSSVTATFLPSLSSHGGAHVPVDIPSGVHVFAPTAMSNSVDDADAGGATPVQDEEPSDEVSLAPMDFLKQVILDSTKSSSGSVSTGSDRAMSYTAHPVELGGATVTSPAPSSWSGYDPSFSQPDGERPTVVYESYDDGYNLVYSTSGVGPELSATVYGPDGIQTYEATYASTYSDPNDASQTYVIETRSADGYVCTRDGYEMVHVEAYTAPDADYPLSAPAAYQEQLIPVVDENYGNDLGEGYTTVVTGDGYPPQAAPGTYYSVVEHLPGVPPPQPSVVYHAVQGYTQPPPAFAHPPPSLAPGASFAHPPPPPSLAQPSPVAFIQPPSFATPPPSLNQPPPVFNLSQNSSLPPLPLPRPFVEPLPPPGHFRLLSPASVKTTVALPLPLLVSSLDSKSPIGLHGSSFGSQWGGKAPYGQFKNDPSRGPAPPRDLSRFENLASPSSDSYRIGRNTRRTNLTYLTQGQAGEDRNGTGRGDRDLSPNLSVINDAKPRYPSTSLRSLSLPCDALASRSVAVSPANGPQSASPGYVDRGNIFSRMQSVEMLFDPAQVKSNSECDGRASEGNKNDGADTGRTPVDGHAMFKNSNSDNEDALLFKHAAVEALSPSKSTTNNIPSLGSPRTLVTKNWSTRMSNCRPQPSSATSLNSFRFRSDSARRGAFRRPHFVTNQLPFQRNFRDNY